MESSKNAAVSIAVPFKGLYFSDYRLYLFSAGLIALDIALPWSTHQFGAPGASLLPMQIFILWAGSLIGVISPMASYLL
jgi:hypothetical protein